MREKHCAVTKNNANRRNNVLEFVGADFEKETFIMGIIVVIIAGYFSVWTAPRNFLDDIQSENIVSISMRNGSTGKNSEITNQEDVTFIVEKIQYQTQKMDENIFNTVLKIIKTMY